MAKVERRDGAREDFWRTALAKFSASGLSIRAFCRGEGLTESAFYAWRREMRLRKSEAALAMEGRPAFVPAMMAAAPSQPSASSACDEATSAASSIALEIVGGCVLRFHGATAAAQLAELVCHLQARGER
jgi:transposase-like protein